MSSLIGSLLTAVPWDKVMNNVRWEQIFQAVPIDKLPNLLPSAIPTDQVIQYLSTNVQPAVMPVLGKMIGFLGNNPGWDKLIDGAVDGAIDHFLDDPLQQLEQEFGRPLVEEALRALQGIARLKKK